MIHIDTAEHPIPVYLFNSEGVKVKYREPTKWRLHKAKSKLKNPTQPKPATSGTSSDPYAVDQNYLE